VDIDLSRIREYESPFQIPECTSPEDALRYSTSHSVSRSDRTFHTPCPVHQEYDASYRRIPNHHAEWHQYREEYAKTGDEKALRCMLSCVTETVPPDAPARKTPVPPTVRWGRVEVLALIPALFAAGVIVAWLILS
jgi:hypothetical protein